MQGSAAGGWVGTCISASRLGTGDPEKLAKRGRAAGPLSIQIPQDAFLVGVWKPRDAVEQGLHADTGICHDPTWTSGAERPSSSRVGGCLRIRHGEVLVHVQVSTNAQVGSGGSGHSHLYPDALIVAELVCDGEHHGNIELDKVLQVLSTCESEAPARTPERHLQGGWRWVLMAVLLAAVLGSRAAHLQLVTV